MDSPSHCFWLDEFQYDYQKQSMVVDNLSKALEVERAQELVVVADLCFQSKLD